MPSNPQIPTRAHKFLICTRLLQHGSSGHMKDQTFTTKPTSAHKPPKPHQTPTACVPGPYKSPQTLRNSLNHNGHLHLEPLGHIWDHTLTASSQGATNPLNNTRHLHWAIKGPHPHPGAHKHLLNSTRHLHLGSVSHTRNCTLTAEPTSAHKLPKPHQTLTLWVLGPCKGQPHNRGAYKCPQTH